ncbi:hypothetical protein V1512DRAFT_267340 [Lipomyces arxii]|uniref:uncharacterized protein n=1 Tax=Lipomyces arxii TaxID=56418 RepID=UPI0034CEC698
MVLSFESESDLFDFTSFGSEVKSFDPFEGLDSLEESRRTSDVMTISPDMLTQPSSVLSSPLDSPTECYDSSPIFDTRDTPDAWGSLFESEVVSRPCSVSSMSTPMTSSLSISSDESRAEGVIVAADGSVVGISERKRKRVTSQSYTRRPRVEPLPPIMVDDAEDTIAVKRARNTLAARRSRERKMLRLTDLEVQVVDLVSERDAALKKVEELEREVARLRGG